MSPGKAKKRSKDKVPEGDQVAGVLMILAELQEDYLRLIEEAKAYNVYTTALQKLVSAKVETICRVRDMVTGKPRHDDLPGQGLLPEGKHVETGDESKRPEGGSPRP